MIKLTNIKKEYNSASNKVIALNGVSLSVEKGEVFGVIGLSGAGKSTLIRVVNRLEEPTIGQVTIDGVDLLSLNSKELNEKRKKIGMIFQHFNLLSSRNVYENISLPLELMKVPKKVINEKVTNMLKLVGLSDKRTSSISHLSGGQKQRVAIARALATSPEILLCDEATSALDPRTTKEILNLISSLRDELDLTVILITHEMNVITEICNKVAVIENGLIVESGVVSDVFENPSEEITKELVKAV